MRSLNACFCSLTKTRNGIKANLALEADLFANDIDICVVSETHLRRTAPDSVVAITNYTTYRKDRNWFANTICIRDDKTLVLVLRCFGVRHRHIGLRKVGGQGVEWKKTPARKGCENEKHPLISCASHFPSPSPVTSSFNPTPTS